MNAATVAKRDMSLVGTKRELADLLEGIYHPKTSENRSWIYEVGDTYYLQDATYAHQLEHMKSGPATLYHLRCTQADDGTKRLELEALHVTIISRRMRSCSPSFSGSSLRVQASASRPFDSLKRKILRPSRSKS